MNAQHFVGRGFVSTLTSAFPEVNTEHTGLVDLLQRLGQQGYDTQIGVDFVIEGIRTGRWLVEVPRSQLRVGDLNAVFASVNDDPFIVHKFRDDAAARNYLESEEKHAMRVGRFVFRSLPNDMYYNKAGFGQRPDNEVSWSRLLADEDFITAAATVVFG